MVDGEEESPESVDETSISCGFNGIMQRCRAALEHSEMCLRSLCLVGSVVINTMAGLQAV